MTMIVLILTGSIEMGTTYTLSDVEMMTAVMVGGRRTVTAINRKHTDRVPNKELWRTDIEGAGAEMVVAKHLGRYWEPTDGTYKAPDLGSRVQVRQTKHGNGRLRICPNDDPEHAYVLVTGIFPHLTVHGWLLGRDCMKEEYLDNPDKSSSIRSWFVPQEDLKPLGGKNGQKV